MLNRFFGFTDSLYARYFSAKALHRVESAIVFLAIAGFLINLLLVYIDQNFPHLDLLAGSAPASYLSAIYTPFSIILLFEIFLLIAAIPESTTRSVARQYEIISLIIIRNVFKDIAGLESITNLTANTEVLTALVYHVVGGALIFLLVTVFYFVRHKYPPKDMISVAAHAQLVSVKKMITLFLAGAVIFVIARSFLAAPGDDFNFDIFLRLDSSSGLFESIFAMLIFFDVLLLIISYLYSDRYELVFRNACYVISVILIRFSLSVEPPENIVVIAGAMLLGIFASLIYSLYGRYRLSGGRIEHVQDFPRTT